MALGAEWPRCRWALPTSSLPITIAAKPLSSINLTNPITQPLPVLFSVPLFLSLRTAEVSPQLLDVLAFSRVGMAK